MIITTNIRDSAQTTLDRIVTASGDRKFASDEAIPRKNAATGRMVHRSHRLVLVSASGRVVRNLTTSR